MQRFLLNVDSDNGQGTHPCIVKMRALANCINAFGLILINVFYAHAEKKTINLGIRKLQKIKSYRFT